MHRIWGLLFGVVLLAVFVLTAVSPSLGWWLPMGASTYSPEIDRLYYLILAVVTFFYVLTEVLMVINIIRSGAPGRKAQFTHGNHRLEIIWSVVPGVILVTLAVIQIHAWADIKYPSHLADKIGAGEKYLQMGVEARQWEFRIRYPSLARIDEWDREPKLAQSELNKRLPERFDDVWVPNDIHCWKGRKVLMHFRTRDVGHALFFPNLRLKQDALPGRTIPVWFEATESNTKFDAATQTWADGYRPDGTADKHHIFHFVCPQYCGTRHSLMRGKLFVHPTKEDFLAWLKHAHEMDTNKQGSPAAVAALP